MHCFLLLATAIATILWGCQPSSRRQEGKISREIEAIEEEEAEAIHFGPSPVDG